MEGQTVTSYVPLNHDPLDFVERDRVGRSILELRGFGRGVRRNLLGVLEGPAVRQIRGDSGRPKRVTAGRGREPRGPHDHGMVTGRRTTVPGGHVRLGGDWPGTRTARLAE